MPAKRPRGSPTPRPLELAGIERLADADAPVMVAPIKNIVRSADLRQQH